MTSKLNVRMLLALTLPWSAVTNAQWTRAAAPTAGAIHCFLAVGQKLFAGADSCLLISTDDGANWEIENKSITDINCLGSYGDYLFASSATQNNWFSIGLYRSADGGASWNGPNPYGYFDSFSVVDSSLLITGIESNIDNPKGLIMASTDSGGTWSGPITSLPSPYFICEIQSLCASDSAMYVVSCNLAFRSTDFGTSWTQMDIGSRKPPVYSLIVSGTSVFSGTSDGVYRSTDNGISWTAVDSGLSADAVIGFTLYHGDVFACTHRGVFLSADTGHSWRDVSTGLPDSSIISVVVNDSALCVGTAGDGIWRTPLSDVIASVKHTHVNGAFRFALEQNYPNPFNPSTVISYELPTNELVSLKVFDVLGREVETLVNQRQNAGNHSVKFNASSLSSGVYFYRLEAGTYHETKKLLFLK